MLYWLVLITVIAAIAIFGVWISASIFGRGEVLPPMDEPRDVIAANRRAIDEGRYDDIALEVVPRGYRQDQVDALVAHLTRHRDGAEERKIGHNVPSTDGGAPKADSASTSAGASNGQPQPQGTSSTPATPVKE